MRANVFRPTASPHQQATSTGTADVQTLTLPATTQAVFLSVETTGCYLTVDGTTPSSSNGIFLPTGVLHFVPLGPGLTVKFASSAAAVSKVNALYGA